MAEPGQQQFWTKPRRLVLAVGLMALLFFYVGSYLVLSRAGLERSRRMNDDCYYYLPLDADRTYRVVAILYVPINWLDVEAGTGWRMETRIEHYTSLGRQKH